MEEIGGRNVKKTNKLRWSYSMILEKSRAMSGLPKEDNPYGDHTFNTFTESHCFSAAEMSSNDERNVILFNAYDWLGDTAMTSHICNQRDTFVKFKAESPKVKGVANSSTVAKG